MRPGTRFFVGPLTVAQQRRRMRSRQSFHDANEIADARNIPMADAFKLLRKEYCPDCEKVHELARVCPSTIGTFSP